MVTTGQVLSESTQIFIPIIGRTIEITKEMLIYVVYIELGIIGIELMRYAVKYILNYLKKKNMTAFYTYEDDVQRNKDGNSFKIVRKRKPRKKIKWKYFRRFR